MFLERYQGTTDDNKRFGYVAGDDGGYFFTWHDSLAQTLASIEEDEQDGDGGLDVDEVREFLEEKISAAF